MLTVSNKNLFKRITITNHSLIEFSSDVQLNVVVYDKMNIFNCNKEQTQMANEAEIDIGEVMKTRAKQGYGVQDFIKNISLISNNQLEDDVRYMWQWLECKSVFVLGLLCLMGSLQTTKLATVTLTLLTR